MTTGHPTQALVIKWFRVKYDIHVKVDRLASEKEIYTFHIINDASKTHKGSGNFTVFDNELMSPMYPVRQKSYEEATDAAILYVLNNLI